MSQLATIEPAGGALDVAARLNPRQVIEQLAEVLGPEGLTQGLLETLKVPSGSSSPAWSVMDIEQGEEVAKREITGVILASRYVRGYWKEKLGTRAAVAPDCSSKNSILGAGNPGGNCLTCPFAQYGSAINEKGEPSDGQACKQMMEIWLIRPEMMIPSILRVPPTSIKAGKQYLLGLTGKGIQVHTALSAFTLSKTTNKNNVPYMQINFRFVGRLEPQQVEGMAMLRQYVTQLVGTHFTLNSDDYVTVDPAPASERVAPEVSHAGAAAEAVVTGEATGAVAPDVIEPGPATAKGKSSRGAKGKKG